MAQRAATRKPFSTEEEEALRRGVQRHGHNWATILGSGSFQPQRTNVDLKDKWRNMRKAGAEAKENVGADLQVVPVRPDRKRAREDPAPRPARSMRSGAASGQRGKSAVDPTECATPVAPYLRDIDRHYLATEGLRRPCPSYLLAQPDLNARMRAILVDWLVEVHFKFKLRPETLYLTVHLIDCYLEKEAVTRQRRWLKRASTPCWTTAPHLPRWTAERLGPLLRTPKRRPSRFEPSRGPRSSPPAGPKSRVFHFQPAGSGCSWSGARRCLLRPSTRRSLLPSVSTLCTSATRRTRATS